ILACHAVLSNSGAEMSIEPVSPDAKVVINGQQIMVKTPLQHMDRLMLGSNCLFLYVGYPADRASQGDTKEYSYDFFQQELAQSQGMTDLLGTPRLGEGANEAMDKLVFQDFVQLMPKVDEVNAMSKDMNKAMTFQPIIKNLASHDSLGNNKEMEVEVLVTNTLTNQVWMWSKAKFINRKFLIEELYQQYMEEGKLDVEQANDPFWDPVEDVFLGSAHVWLQSLAYRIQVDEQIEVHNYQGKEEAMVQVVISPADAHGSGRTDLEGLVTIYYVASGRTQLEGLVTIHYVASGRTELEGLVTMVQVVVSVPNGGEGLPFRARCDGCVSFRRLMARQFYLARSEYRPGLMEKDFELGRDQGEEISLSWAGMRGSVLSISAIGGATVRFMFIRTFPEGSSVTPQVTTEVRVEQEGTKGPGRGKPRELFCLSEEVGVTDGAGLIEFVQEGQSMGHSSDRLEGDFSCLHVRQKQLPDTEAMVIDPSELLGKRLDFIISIPQCLGMKWIQEEKSRGSMFSFQFYGTSNTYRSKPVWHSPNAKTNFTQQFTINPVSMEFLQYLQTHALVLDMWGLQEGREDDLPSSPQDGSANSYGSKGREDDPPSSPQDGSDNGYGSSSTIQDGSRSSSFSDSDLEQVLHMREAENLELKKQVQDLEAELEKLRLSEQAARKEKFSLLQQLEKLKTAQQVRGGGGRQQNSSAADRLCKKHCWACGGTKPPQPDINLWPAPSFSGPSISDCPRGLICHDGWTTHPRIPFSSV
ncbi:organelle transport along microtubule, partial [Branchiostoma belcheri]